MERPKTVDLQGIGVMVRETVEKLKANGSLPVGLVPEVKIWDGGVVGFIITDADLKDRGVSEVTDIVRALGATFPLGTGNSGNGMFVRDGHVIL